MPCRPLVGLLNRPHTHAPRATQILPGKVKSDNSLQEKLKAATSREDVVGIAKEHGHELTADKIFNPVKKSWKAWLGIL